MSPNWGELRQWDPGVLEDVASRINRRGQELETVADDLRRARPEGWVGDAAEAAGGKRERIAQRFESLTDEAGAVRGALQRAVDALEPLLRTHGDAEELAGRHHFGIADSGGIIDHGLPGVEHMAAEQAEAVRAERERVRQQLVEDTRRVLAQAEEIDAELASILERAAGSEIVDADEGDPARIQPPIGDSAEHVYGWWDELSEAEQQEVIDEHTRWVGSTDGIPVVARDEANRIVLEQEKQQLLDRRGEAENAGDSDTVDEIDAQLEGVSDIEKRLESTADAPEDQRHYLLDIDSDNAGQAIVAKGNPDTATNTATYVPGTGAGLEGVDELINRSESMHREANFTGSDSTSVITWVGYDAPQNVVTEASSEEYAQAAAPDLAAFQEGLQATHESPETAQHSLFGHSYGSTTIGHAASDAGLEADAVVFVGSPGVGVDHASELGSIDSDDVYATTARNDIIQAAPDFVHGQDPVAYGFGARTFDSDPGSMGWTGGYSVDAHSEYWDDGNEFLDHAGLIIAGRPVPGSDPDVVTPR